MSLRVQVFRGSLVMLATTLGLRVTSIVSTVLIARLLEPAAFGIISLATVVIAAVELVAPLGLPAALIQRQEDREKAAYQVFLVTAGTGLVFYVAILLLAPFTGRLLANEMVSEVLPWVGLRVFLGGLTRVPEALIEKDMAFNRLSVIMIANELGYIVTALGLAVSGAGIWSLVAGMLARAVIELGLSWGLGGSPGWLARKPWDRSLMKQLLDYGWRSVAGRLVYFFYTNVDNIVVGRAFGASALGFYSKAFDFTTKTVDNINKTIGVVLFPSYARIQHDRTRLWNAYLRSLRLISSVTVPLAMGIWSVAPELVPVLLGEKWVPMVPILQILAFMSLVKPLSSTTSALFNGMGYPGFNSRAAVVVAVAMMLCMVIFYGWRAEGIALAVFVSHVVGFAFNVYQVGRLFRGLALRMLEVIAPAVGFAGAMMLSISLSRPLLARLFGEHPSAWTLLGLIGIGVAVYSGLIALFQRGLVDEVVSLLRSRKQPLNT